MKETSYLILIKKTVFLADNRFSLLIIIFGKLELFRINRFDLKIYAN